MEKYSKFTKREPNFNTTTATVDVFSLNVVFDNNVLDGLSEYIVSQYMDAESISMLAEVCGYTVPEYIDLFVLPNTITARKVAVGEFGEIISSDILEEHYGYVVPRYKLKNKPDCNVAAPLVDIIGYKMKGDLPSENDILCLAEVKTNLSANVRKAEYSAFEEVNTKLLNNIRNCKTVNYFFNQARLLNDLSTVSHLRRFMKKSENEYSVEKYGFTITIGSYPKDSDYSFITSGLEDNKHFIYVYSDNMDTVFEEGYSRKRK